MESMEGKYGVSMESMEGKYGLSMEKVWKN